MAKQRVGLGRGLDALISGASTVTAPQQSTLEASSEALPLVEVESIVPNPRQPRRTFRDDDPKLLELSASIKEHGLIQPIIVMRLNKSSTIQQASDWFGTDDVPPSQDSTSLASTHIKYQIIAGERRWRAVRMAGLSKVPVVIKDVTPLQMLELALVENIQRADLNPIEEALAYQALVQEFGLTQEQVAKQVGKDRTTITNSLRLLQLAPEVRDTLINQSENFTEGHARALAGLPREEDQVHAMQQIISFHLTVRQAEDLVGRMKREENVEKAPQSVDTPLPRSSEIESLTTDFRDALMVKVDLKCNAKGKGTLVLHFNSQEELEGLYNRLVKEKD